MGRIGEELKKLGEIRGECKDTYVSPLIKAPAWEWNDPILNLTAIKTGIANVDRESAHSDASQK